MPRPPLRVGLLVDSLVQPAWVCRVLDDIRSSPAAELALVVRNGAHRETSLLEQVRAYRRQLLPLLYDRLDAFLVRGRRRPDAFARRSIAELVAGCPVLDVRTIQERYSDYFPDDDVERILAYNLDVALRFGFRILRGRALRIAKHGVWSYHHGDNLEIRGGPNSFWEVMQARPVTGSVLQVLTEDLDAGEVIYRSHSRTNPLSLSLNRNPHYWKTAAFVRRKLEDLCERGPAALEDDPCRQRYRAYDERLYTRPGNLAAVPLLARLGGRLVAAAACQAVFEERPLVAVSLSKQTAEMQTAFFRCTPLAAPPGSSLAEPFPVEHGGRFYVFVQEYRHAEQRGRISVVELDGQGRAGAPAPVLERPGHLGYPFVFAWRGEWYLLPDRGGPGDVELFRCRSFPGEWEPVAVLLRGVHAARASLAEVDGTWWLFVALAEPGAAPDDELHLFSAESPLGPWTPHRRNPVKSDVRSARPAGRLFRWRGGLYRPAQDCTRPGGYAISVNQVLRLDAEAYEEVEVTRIEPRWRAGLVATRTLNHAGRLTCIDGVERRLRR